MKSIIETLPEMIHLLNGDLAREYAHWHFYMNAAMRITGLDREEYKEFLLKEAAGEMAHISEFGDLIVGLGGIPVCYPTNFADYSNNDLRDWKASTTAQTILRDALKMEEEVCGYFVQRMEDAENLGKSHPDNHVHGRYIEIFLEDQLMDSRKAVDHLRQILR
jgi:bacterioferritin (cytochrome b1)